MTQCGVPPRWNGFCFHQQNIRIAEYRLVVILVPGSGTGIRVEFDIPVAGCPGNFIVSTSKEATLAQHDVGFRSELEGVQGVRAAPL